LTLIGVLLTLAGEEGQGAEIFLLMEACKDGLIEQELLRCDPLPIFSCWFIELALFKGLLF
jgi:hypothetical protein